jgi:hypothetical protein
LYKDTLPQSTGSRYLDAEALVARTKRIPVEQRAEAAVIAWMRHRTTGYDNMVIPRVKGQRREVRRMLARRSHELLQRYRRGELIPEGCPLRRALAGED